MRVHFIAIGGSAMHNLALALAERGVEVSGSDDEIFEPSKSRLERKGILPAQMGWFPEKLDQGIDAVILGMHARIDNPELIQAKNLGLPIYSYPEYLYEQSKEKTRVVIAGSHGKTTITSMILHVLNYHGRKEAFMVGAQLEGYDTMVSFPEDAEFMVLEGDEYLSSPIDLRPKFHLYHPNIALISGIAWDHINVFPTFDDYLVQFKRFIELIEPGGALVYNESDEVLKQLVEADKSNIKKFAYRTPKYRVESNRTFLETAFGEVPLEIFGAHNLNNLEGARWICLEMGIQEEEFYEAIASFKGASKRLEPVADNGMQTVFKDFAHAPSKVKATVTAVKEQYNDRRVVACLELHTFSSLNPDFLPQYAGSLEKADVAIVYFNPNTVSHKKLPELKVEHVQQAFNRKDIVVLNSSAEVVTTLQKFKADKTVYLLMSSGNFDGYDLNKLGLELTQG